MENQVVDFREIEPEWAIDHIISYCRSGADANLEVRWTSGDLTWISFSEVYHLSKVLEYLELVGVTDIKDLPWRKEKTPKEDAYLFNAACMPCFQQPHPTPIQSFCLMRLLTDDLSKSHTI